MTDKPARTMMLSAHEWRALVYAGASGICTQVNMMTSAPDREGVAAFHETLDRLKMQVSAWSASGQPAQTPYQAPSTGDPQHAESANGSGALASAASGPKKKRGWQKGRKRGPRKPRTDEAVQ